MKRDGEYGTNLGEKWTGGSRGCKMKTSGGKKERPDGGQEEGGGALHGKPCGGGGGGGGGMNGERKGGSWGVLRAGDKRGRSCQGYPLFRSKCLDPFLSCRGINPEKLLYSIEIRHLLTQVLPSHLPLSTAPNNTRQLV